MFHTAVNNFLFSPGDKLPFRELGHEFLCDMGAEPVKIDHLDGVYLDPSALENACSAAFEKWHPRFQTPEYKHLADRLEINVMGTTFRELLRLPPNAARKEFDLDKRAVVCFTGMQNLYEINPQVAATYALRGKHVLMVNYSSVGESEGKASYSNCLADGIKAVRWLKERLGIGFNQMVAVGFSLGASPALHAATQCQELDVILDRPFSTMTDVLPNALPSMLCPLIAYIIKDAAPYDNKEMLTRVTGRVLVLEAREDELMKGQAVKLLEGTDIEPTTVKGGHKGKCDGDTDYSWYAHEESQEVINRFFQ